jgi:hypothetical protein
MATKPTEQQTKFWGGASDPEAESDAEHVERLRGVLRVVGLSPAADATIDELRALLRGAEQQALWEVRRASRPSSPDKASRPCQACGGTLAPAAVWRRPSIEQGLKSRSAPGVAGYNGPRALAARNGLRPTYLRRSPSDVVNHMSRIRRDPASQPGR